MSNLYQFYKGMYIGGKGSILAVLEYNNCRMCSESSYSKLTLFMCNEPKGSFNRYLYVYRSSPTTSVVGLEYLE